MRKLTILLLFPIFFSIPALAGWTRAGLYGADVRALAVDPNDADVFYLGTSQGEVYVSTDGAETWVNPRAANPFPGYVIDNLAVDARGRLWVAGWGLWGDSVIAVSADRGESWTRRDAGLSKLSIRALALDPQNPEGLAVGALNGVFLSRDDGKSWTRISSQVNVNSLAIDPRSENTIYVGTWRQAWRTDDGGKNWKHIASGMVLDTDVFSINIDPSDPANVWISTCGWVYNSKDRGDSWTRFKDGFDNRRIHTIERDPENSSVLYAGSVAGVYCSRDGGQKWALTSPDSLVINGIAIHPDRPERIVLGTEGDGIYVSNDRGATWERNSDGLYNVRVASVIPDPAVPNRIYATVFFGGSSSGVYVSEDGGANWARLNTTPLPEILALMVRKEGDSRFVAGTIQGFFWSVDGVEWTRAEPLITPVRVDKLVEYSDKRLFAGTALGVFTSRDGGKKWYRLGLEERTIDLALGRTSSGPALYALTDTGLHLYDGTAWSAIAGVQPRGRTLAVRRWENRDLVLIAGSQGVDAGFIGADRSWKKANAPRGEFGSVYAAANTDGTIFLAFNDRHEIHLFDGKGSQWETVGIPTTLRDVAGVAEDPFRGGKFYLGTHGQGILIWDKNPPMTAQQAPATAVYGATGGAK